MSEVTEQSLTENIDSNILDSSTSEAPQPIPSKALSLLAAPLTLRCGLVLPNRTVKCAMQETLSGLPHYAPNVEKFERLYGEWSKSNFGLIISGQVQVDLKYLSKPGDVVTRPESLSDPAELELFKRWATIAQSGGTPCILQLAHPGRMSPIGAGVRLESEQAICPSVVPVQLVDTWIEKRAVKKLFGIPRECTHEDIESVKQSFLTGALVARAAGFAGAQLHNAHGFLLSQFLSPYTNRRTDKYGGTPEKRMVLLQELVYLIREHCPAPFCLGIKLNSGDYMRPDQGGLVPDEAIKTVEWLIDCGLVDFIEISGGNAEASTSNSRLSNSFKTRSITAAPVIKESTRVRESFFTDFAERVMELQAGKEVKVPIQLSGGFRSRVGMADAIDSGVCDLVGLGRSVVLDPTLPRSVLLNPEIPDELAFAKSHIVNGLWVIPWIPVRAVGNSLVVGWFYYQMHRLGAGLKPDLQVGLPYLLWTKLSMPYRTRFYNSFWRLFGYQPVSLALPKIVVAKAEP